MRGRGKGISYADKTVTEDRFDRILEEMRQDRERETRKWEDNQQVINEMLKDIHALTRKHDNTPGAPSDQWERDMEQACRAVLKKMLKEFPGAEVINVLEFDDEGLVFGRPDQIELDLIIKNGALIIAEIKTSISKSEMYIFEKKVRYYENRHQRRADKMIVISPMIAPNAIPVAEKLGITLYSAAEDVKI